MKSTARAPANIAFIKYWGKQDEVLHLPLNSSFSMNLSGAYTTTTVEFSDGLKSDQIELIGGIFSAAEKKKITTHLDMLRKKANSTLFAKVVTQNTFPKGGGIASSASGFAAVTVAAVAALQMHLSEKEMTILARLGSGSAARSIPDGFVEWIKSPPAGGSDQSYACSVFPSTYWDIRDCICIVETEMKKTSSTGGMKDVVTSPYLFKRLQNVASRLIDMKAAFTIKDFKTVGTLIEADCLEMHHVMQAQNPPCVYWNSATKIIMLEINRWRKAGLSVYFTIDAGSNVHVIYEGKDEVEVVEKLKKISEIKEIILNKPAPGAHILHKHLF